jgi:TetR/AcrR family transcriptional regulator, cholesterol catabolism regulator
MLNSTMGRPKNSGIKTPGQTAMRLTGVAIDLFSRRGFKGTSIRDIAKETGLTTSAIYHNFGTKAGLLAAIEDETIEPMMQLIRNAYAMDLPAVDRLALLMKTHLTYIATNRNKCRIFFLNEDTLPRGKRDLNRKRQKEIFFMYRSEIERVTRSTGRRQDPTIAAFAVLGSIMWLLTWYSSDGQFSMEEVVNGIVEQVLQGISGTDLGSGQDSDA